jgi:hypothetical protein
MRRMIWWLKKSFRSSFWTFEYIVEPLKSSPTPPTRFKLKWKFSCMCNLIQLFCWQHQNRLNLRRLRFWIPFQGFWPATLCLRELLRLRRHCNPVAGSFSCTRAYPATHYYYRGWCSGQLSWRDQQVCCEAEGTRE